jgi:tRNA dimethylallyltransferase
LTRHLALIGATASGKSAVAMAAAHALRDVEIVSVDSMQVYRGLDIGTAKPSPAERAAVQHHLVDVADPLDEWSVARFQREARAAIADVERRGRRALLVGGTGLYVRAVLEPLDFPPRDLELRAAILAELADPDALARAHGAFAARDPVAAGRMEPGNRRRLARALEVEQLTGRRFSSFGAGLDAFGPPVIPVSLVGLWLPRTELTRRIEARVVGMYDAGLVDEVRALRDRGWLSPTAAQAIGYREALARVDGTVTPEEAVERTCARTRSFARRQRMWFRRDPRVTWLAAADNPCRTLPALLALWSA